MTKWIVGLLLLVNLALFGWMRWGNLLTEDADSGTLQAALHPDKIRLLDALPASAVAAQSETPGLSLTLSPVSAPASVPAPAATHPATHSSPGVASSPVAVSAPLRPPVAVAASAPLNLAKCAEWGEFSGDDLSRAQQALAVLKLGDNLTRRAVERNHGYWVYIPPLKKRASVEKKIAQLKERGVKDYFVVQEKGKWQNAISLGVFKTRDAAEKYIAMLHTKDVRTAKVGERTSKLKYTVFLIRDLDSGTTDKLNALQQEFPESELKVEACNN
ncbi:hypothetical protein MIZ01_0353 [Sideroxyarcus emersonii]|uniref:SPOR domain-containing protein n=1 Tax=Sideroxyarcus emersonii TaxID=2764705 RepID=A0AAN2BXX9_9PROT|nr:SPOR domain-containing protein [Sideroxyarcus emersonii]BCK86590.1 hypothetical protein MIZ01_0353 [Sideroxyarcus emersonii]